MKKDWTYKKLGEVCETTSGGTPSKSKMEYYENGDIPWLRSGELSNGEIYSTELCITQKGLDNSSAKIIPAGTVSIAMYGATVGEVGIIKKPMCTNQAICNILPNEQFIPNFIRYVLVAYKPKFISLATGGAQPNISQNIIKNTSIPIPPLAIQRSIVAELDLLHSVISKKKEQLRELDNLAQSLFYQMFGDPITNPMGWEIKKLGEVCDVRDGTHDSPKYVQSSDYVLITSKNIVNGEIDFSSCNYITKEDYDSINKRSKVDVGDIIMPMIGTIGGPIIVNETSHKYGIKNVALIKFNITGVLNIYVKSLLENQSYTEYLKSLNKGGTQKFIALGTIRTLPIPLPPLSLQQSFAAKVSAIEAQKQAITQSIHHTEALLAQRMDQYFG